MSTFNILLALLGLPIAIGVPVVIAVGLEMRGQPRSYRRPPRRAAPGPDRAPIRAEVIQ